jgi:tellurium resistance protein TerD
MAINLKKGQRVDIGLEKIGVGLGWDPNKANPDVKFDLDASAFMVDTSSQVPEEGFFVFYNSGTRIPSGSRYPDGVPVSPDGALRHTGDNRTGEGEGDDESLHADLGKVDPRISEIVFTVTIDEFEQRRQNFGQVRNSFIRIYDASTNEEICKYELSEDFSLETAVEFGRLYKRGGSWRFEAMGLGHSGGLATFVSKYAKHFA